MFFPNRGSKGKVLGFVPAVMETRSPIVSARRIRLQRKELRPQRLKIIDDLTALPPFASLV